MSQLKQAGRKQKGQNPPFSTFLFYSCPQWIGWHQPTHTGEVNLCYWVYQLKCYSHLKTISQTQAEIMFNLGILWRISLTHKISHHSDQAPKIFNMKTVMSFLAWLLRPLSEINVHPSQIMIILTILPPSHVLIPRKYFLWKIYK